MVCTEPQCLYKGALYLYLYLSSAEVKEDVDLYLYFPCRPYVPGVG